MADKQGVELPGDFDALLRHTMAAEPSPAFLPRVRERVREERRPSRWMAPWVLAATAAAATLVVALTLPALVGSPAIAPTAPVAPVSRVANAALPPPVQPPAVAAGRVAAVRRAAAVVAASPVVIVDRGQRAALSLYVRLMQQGRLTEEAAAQTVAPSSEPIEAHVLPIAVEPVGVSEISVGGVLQDEVERH